MSVPKYRPGFHCQATECDKPLLWARTTLCQLEKGYGKFCSQKCHGQWNSENRTGENSSGWKGGKVACECKSCGKSFEVPRIKIKKGYGKFCSPKCCGRWISKVKVGEKAPGWKGGKITRECTVCDKGFKVARWRIKNGTGKFCSHGCRGRWQSENKTDENAPVWRGGKSFEPYPLTFNGAFKRKIRARDNSTCAICGNPGRCIHHINYIKDDTIPENCITLCRSCHTKTNYNREHWQSILEKEQPS